jgi:hypothetical protein
MTAASIQRASYWVPCSAGAAASSPKMALVTAEPAAIRQRGSTPGRPPAGEKLAIADRTAGSGTGARGRSDRHAAGVLDLERVPSSSSPIAVRDGDGCINAHAAPLLSAATNGPARLPGPPGFTCPPRGALAILATSLGVRASAALAVCSRDFGGNQAESCTSRRRHPPQEETLHSRDGQQDQWPAHQT